MGRALPKKDVEDTTTAKRRSSTPSEIAEKFEKDMSERNVNMVESGDMYISTGSTLLDLALTGTRVEGGGMPGGIIVEIFGENSLGKTAVLSEICASAQANNGEVSFNDPEARLDRDYAELYGMSLNDGDYQRIKYVDKVFDDIRKWEPENTSTINVYGTDSLAALTTELEMDKGDKMGMRRAKEFSEGLRKTSVDIAVPHKLVVCTNQIRQSEYGTITPGGKGIPFYASIRIELKSATNRGGKAFIVKKTKIGNRGKEIEKTIGINVIARTIKNSKNDPFRTAPICIVFGYGIDDVRANLQYLKDMTGDTKYDCIDKTYQPLEDAINYIEKNNLEHKLKEKVTDLWYEIESRLKVTRKRKSRGR